LTELTFNNDNSYILKTKCLGRDSIAEDESGNFSWNKEGNTVTLAAAKNRPTQYQVGENKITQLDKSGKTIIGALAENYVLAKQTSNMDTGKKSNAELVETYWKLTEIMGKPVTTRQV
jgi:uncharacterized lipoprotein NlpE involved in copper resistance